MNARLLLTVAALAANPAFAAGATASAQPYVTQVLSSRQAKLGEPFQLEVSVTHPASQRWDLELPASLGPFSLLGRTSTTTREGAQATDHLTLKLGLYEPGKHLVPALTLREHATGETVALSQDAQVEAISTLAPREPHQLRDVAPPRALYHRDPWKIAAAAGALVVLAGLALLAAGALRRAWRRLFPPETEEQRDRRLLGQLAALDDEPFFDALDGLLRRGLARWHGVPAVEHTAEEIVSALRATPPAEISVDELAGVLNESVLVRFAHRPTSAARRETALAVCRRIYPPVKAKGAGDARAALS